VGINFYSTSDTPTYDEWKRRLKMVNKEDWYELDGWLFPKPKCIDKGILYHLCKPVWEQYKLNRYVVGPLDLIATTTCSMCETVIPDNIKMIAGLLEW